jgi:ribulose-5-phosphate 4-epimerase/fuculose-1-phosphate aldolase
MPSLDTIVEELVTANRILAHEGVVDSFGHISVRHPERPARFLLSRARAPHLVEAGDIVEYTHDGLAAHGDTRRPYLERFIHGSIYEAREDVQSVVHTHSPNVIPFSVTKTAIKPLMHVCADIGYVVPVWDTRAEFGDTALLVENVEMGRSLARYLSGNSAALMRGHGCVVAGRSIRHAVYIAIYLELAAKLQMQAMQLGDITFLTPAEIQAYLARAGEAGIDRTWEHWSTNVDRPNPN